MAQAARDQNFVTTLLGVSNVDGVTPVVLWADPVTHRLLVDLPSGSGTVTSVSVVTANGFAGSVATATTTPAITLSTTVTGLLKGNGTAISAATPGTDYVIPAGNVATATALATGRTIGITGDLVYTSPAFDGTANVTAAGTLATVNSNVGSFGSTTQSVALTVNGKGLITAASASTITPAVGSITGLGTGVATLLATPSSANLAAAITGETGTGALVFGTSPDFTTAITLGGIAIPTISSTTTFTNKRITRRVVTVNAPGATPTTNSDNTDVANFTGLATAITSMTTNLSGTPADGDLLEFRFLDDGTARGITWGASFVATTIALPTTTVISTCLRVLFEWRSASSKWECLATC